MCELSLTGAFGQNLDAAGVPDTVLVVGTVTDCPELEENAAPGGPPLARITVRVHTSDDGYDVTVETFLPPGRSTWIAAFKGLRCNDEILVSAQCNDDTSCRILDVPATVDCTTGPGNCPEMTFDLDWRDCNADGERTLRVTASLLAPALEDLSWHWGQGKITTSDFLNEAESVATLQVSEADLAISTTVVVQFNPLCFYSFELDGFEPCCPTEAALVVSDSEGRRLEPSELEDCLAPGPYRVEVIQSELPGTTRAWTVDGEIRGEADGSSREIIVGLAAEPVEVAAQVAKPGCPDQSPLSVVLTPCDPPPPEEPGCPRLLDLQVLDADGREVRPGDDCVDPGTYEIRPRLLAGRRPQFNLWRERDPADDTLLATGNGQRYLVNLDDEPRKVEYEGTTNACPDLSDSVTLKPCERPPGRVNPGPAREDVCALGWFLHLFGIAELTAGLLMMACPLVGAPLVPPPVVFWTGLVYAILGLLLAGLGLTLMLLACDMQECGWTRWWWSVLFIVGMVFTHFGSCPACLWMVFPGLGLAALGLAWQGHWLRRCQPTTCEGVRAWFVVLVALVMVLLNLVPVTLCAFLFPLVPSLTVLMLSVMLSVGFARGCFRG